MSRKKKIDIQNSERDIINVAGNFNQTGGILQVENLIIGNGEQTDIGMLKAEQQTLALQFSVSYLETIQKSQSGKALLERVVLEEIWKELNEKHQLLLVGKPGSGKTCTFLQLAKFCSPIYISLRDRSPLFVVSYLVNKIRVAGREPLIKIQDLEAGLSILETQLSNAQMVFFIDDMEVNQEFALQIMALQKGDNLFLYASRSEKELESAGTNAYILPVLSRDEAKEFLRLQNMELGIVKFGELYDASEGNPLYLFYFSKFQIDPLPKDIQSYHQSIWAKLDSSEKECLIFSALSYNPLQVEDLTLLWNLTLVEVIDKIVPISGLLINQEGSLTVFHPAFKEFVLERIQNEGLSSGYKKKLAEFYLTHKKLMNAAVLLVDEDTAKFNEFGEYCINPVIISGDLQLAVKFMETLLQFPKSRFIEGYIRYHLSYVLGFLYKEVQAAQELEKAIGLFAKLRDKKWVLTAQMIKAMNLVESGEKEEGLALADTILIKSEKFGGAFYGRILVNLTKIYMDVSEFKKSADVGKQAFDLFEKMNEPEGMVASLANLASSLSQLDDYRDLAEQYALKLLTIPEKSREFGIRMIALNILTSINRKKKDYETAKKYGEEAVNLCRQYQLPDKVILNLINYGNIIRDEGKLDDAVKIYEEALVLVNEIGLKREETRIYWILTSLYREKDEMQLSIEYADKAIAIAEKSNFTYSFAHAWEEKARTLYLMDSLREAAEAYEKSGRIFLSIAQFAKDARKSLLQAIDLYIKVGDTKKVNELLAEAIKDRPQDNVEDLKDLMESEAPSNDPQTVHASFLELAKKYRSNGFGENAIRKFLVYVNYCHKNSASGAYNAVLEELAISSSTNRFARTTLAILLDQSRELTDEKAFSRIRQKIADSLPGFYFRETSEQSVYTASITDVLRLQVVVFKTDPLTNKLALVPLLFFYAAPELVIVPDSIAANSYKVMLMNRSDMEASGAKLNLNKEFSEHIQTLQMRVGRDAVGDTILVNTDYEQKGDLEIFPNNKCLMYYVGMLVVGIASHLTGTPVHTFKGDTKHVTRKLAFFFDYTNIEDAKTLNKAFEVNVQKIK